MSAVTLAVLRQARADAQQHHSDAAFAYRDALRKAPGPVAAAHLLGVAYDLTRLAARVLVRWVRS